MRRPAADIAITVLVMLTFPGCSRWRLAAEPTPEVLAAERPELVRITRGDGTRIELRDPVVRGDSIEGIASVPLCTAREALLVADAGDCPLRDVPVVLHGSEMVELEVRERSVARSVTLAVGLAVLVAYVVRVSVRAFGS